MRKLLFFFVLTCFTSLSAGPNGVEIPKSLEDPFFKELEQAEVPQDNRFFQEFLKMLFFLGLLIALLLIVSWVLKRMLHGKIEQMNATNAIRVLERRQVTPRTSLYLIEAFGKGMIIAESSNGVSCVGDVEIPRDLIKE